MGLGVAHLTALELAPQALVRQAASAGFSAVGLLLHPAMAGGLAYPVLAGSAQLRELQITLLGEGVRVYDVEFVELRPDVAVGSFAWLLEAAAELGATCLTVSGDDPLHDRLLGNFAGLCELAQGFGIRVDMEFMRWREIGSLEQALAIISQAGQANAGVLVDALHLYRSGGSAQALAAANPAWLNALQLCDAPLAAPPEAGIIAEAREGRLPPGQGELPLLELLHVLAPKTAISVEMPMPKLPPSERLALACGAAQQLLGQRL